MRNPLLAMTAAIATCTAAHAQTIATYEPFAATVSEHQPWTMMLPMPGMTTSVYPAPPLLPPAPGLVPLPGGSTFDGINGLLWHCDGTSLASQATPLFAPKAVPMPPFAIAAPALAAIGGYASGIALDPTLNILFVVGPAAMVVGVAPIPGTPILIQPFPLMFPTLPPAGLEWDGVTGTLYTVDIAGAVWPFLVGGGPAGPVIPPSPALPPPIGGVCIDKSGQPNAAGLMPIYVTGGGMVDDVMLPMPMPFPVGPPLNVGLTYVGAPASNPVGPGVACPTFAPGPVWSTTSVMTAGNPTWGLQLSQLPPTHLVMFAFDWNFNPAWPLLNGIGCPVGFVLGSPTIVTALMFTNAAGTATFNMPLSVPPLFGPIYHQGFALCSADPAGFVVTPMLSIWASGL